MTTVQLARGAEPHASRFAAEAGTHVIPVTMYFSHFNHVWISRLSYLVESLLLNLVGKNELMNLLREVPSVVAEKLMPPLWVMTSRAVSTTRVALASVPIQGNAIGLHVHFKGPSTPPACFKLGQKTK